MRTNKLLGSTLLTALLMLLGLQWHSWTTSAHAAIPTESVTLLAQADSWVDEGVATATHGSDSQLRLGRTGTATVANREVYLRFDLSSIPANAVVSNAQLTLFQTQASGATSYDVWPEAAAGAWGESTLTWSNRPGRTSQGDAPLSVASGSGSRSWNVTLLLQNQFSGAIEPFGIVLRGDGSTFGERVFNARSSTTGGVPQLVITYTIPSSTPTHTATRTNTATRTPTRTATNTRTATRTPTRTPPIIANPPTNTPTRTPPIIANPPTNTPTRTPPIIANPPTNTPTRTPPVIANPPTNTPTETPTPLPDLQILGMEITQGTQNLANDMPLVAGRETRIRLYVRHDASTENSNFSSLYTNAQVRAYRNGVELPKSPRQANSIVPVNNFESLEQIRGSQTTSFTFYIYPEWRNQPGDVTFTVEVNHDETVAERNYDNNTMTRKVTFKSVTTRPYLYMMPLELYPGGDKSNGARIYTHEDSDWERIAGHVLRYHPLDWFEVWVTSFTLKADNGTVWKLTTYDGRQQVLDALQNWRLKEGKNIIGPTQTLVGMVHPDIDMDTVAGAYSSGQIINLMDSTTGGHGSWYLQGGVTLAHEVGHSRELKHSGCKAEEENVDQDYPWSDNCMLAPNDPEGYFGLGLYYWYTNTPDKGQVFSPDDGGPMMSYNEPKWISPYEYCRLLNKYGVSCTLDFDDLGREIEAEPEPAAVMPVAQDTELLLLRGVISPTAGSGLFTHVEHLADPTENARLMAAAQAAQRSALSQEPGITLVQLGANGSALATTPVLLTSADDELEEEFSSYFFEVVALEAGVARVQLRLGTRVLAERIVSANPPTVQLLGPNSGRVGPGTTLTWSASDADGDELRFSLFYSDDDGARWTLMVPDLQGTSYTIPDYDKVPGSTQGRFRVEANDGFHTATDESDGRLEAPNHAPTVKIVNPTGLYLAEGEAASFQAMAVDIEDGQLALEELSWSSNRDGALGRGGLIGADLSNGVHQLTVRATDSAGQSGSDTITVYVGIPMHRLHLPMMTR